MNATASSAPITLSGRQRLRDEQVRLQQRLQATTERLREELPDRDDLNWYLTQEELGRIHNRLSELQAALVTKAETSGPVEAGVVGPGSRVTVQDESGRRHSFLIVAPIETDATQGYISFNSPVGAALIGRRPGESVGIRTPAGERRLTVLGVGTAAAVGGE